MVNLGAYLTLADSVPGPSLSRRGAPTRFAELRDVSTRLDTHFSALLDDKDKQLRDADPTGLAWLCRANRKLGPPKRGRPRVAFLGDSITGEWRFNLAQRLTPLADAQGPSGKDLSNAGLFPNSKDCRLMTTVAPEAIDKALGPPLAAVASTQASKPKG